MFMHDFFIGHTEGGVGTFTAGDVRLSSHITNDKPSYELDATVWIAPFDMGISQTVSVKTVPSERIERVYEIVLTFLRRSGEIKAWERMNIGFIRHLRKQFLIWRIVHPDSKQEFAERLDKQLSQL